MEDYKKLAYIKIFEGCCTLMVDKYGYENACKYCPFYGCNACEKERISKKDDMELLEIEAIILEKVLTKY